MIWFKRNDIHIVTPECAQGFIFDSNSNSIRVQLVRNSLGSNDVERHSLPPAMFCPLNPLSAEECALHRFWRHETQSEFVQRRHRGSLRKPHHAHTEPRQGAKVEDCVKMLVYPGRSKIVPQFNTHFGLFHYWYGNDSCPLVLRYFKVFCCFTLDLCLENRGRISLKNIWSKKSIIFPFDSLERGASCLSLRTCSRRYAVLVDPPWWPVEGGKEKKN